MRSRVELARHLLDDAYRLMMEHLDGITLEEALYVPEGGYRSVLGTIKHAAGWSHVYRSHAFDTNPKGWDAVDWPRGLCDTIVKSLEYVDDVIAWFGLAHEQWLEGLSGIKDEQVDELRPLHWGKEAPLYDIVVMIAGHHIYHAGELNQILSICRGEAWEDGEEVEENNVCTIGHRVTPPWKRQR